MMIAKAILADSAVLPLITALGYEYVVAAEGLFIRAEDSRMEALVPIAYADLHGLEHLDPYARLKVPLISNLWLLSILASARRHLPNEVHFQFEHLPYVREFAARLGFGPWACGIPEQTATPGRVTYQDLPQAVVDLHSHGALGAFFSTTDDGDEQGLRFYCVIGKVDRETPEILCRAGVYGHHWEVPATTVFDGLGPFVDLFGCERESEQVEEEMVADIAEEEMMDGAAE